MESIVLPIVEKIAEYSVAPVVQQFGYLIRYKSNVVHLTDQVQQLCNKRDGVNMEVEPARKALMRIDPGVESWLEEVQKIMEEKETRFKEETVATKATCCNGWFPNLKGRYSLGRKAQKMTLAVADLLARDLGTIAHPAPHPEVEFQPRGASSSGTSNHIPQPTFTGRTIDFESRRSTITDVMEALKGNQVSAIVICGMGGIGKTTLVNEVINKAKIEGIFDEYTKAVVTETPNRGNIQRDLAEYLGLPLTEEGLEARADKLRKRLSDTTRVLVVLDNVWTSLDLWKIGIPCNPKSCKILVTSRNQDVFNEIEETRKKFPIGVLPESEAWNLFKKVAGDYIESDLELRSIAKQVLRECDGLPVAISTLGSALRQKTKPVWKDALGQLQKPFRGDIRGMKDNVYQTIRLSYDFVEREEAKSCFMLCCVFPESTDILIEDLVTHGLGLGLFQGIDSVEGGRDRVEALLDTLRSCYLLLDTDKKKRVRMHDVVRAVGLYIASDESGRGGTFLVRHGVALEGWPQRYTCSSLIVTANKSSPELLFLSGTDEEKRSSLEIPDTLDGVEDLKVLDLSVPSGLITSFPGMRRRRPRLTSLSVLLRNIQTLCLKNLELELQAISVIGELRTLMILRLSGSTIRHVPEEFKYLCNLKLLDLADCWKLEISPGIISSLSKLEELNLWGSFDKWDDAGMMSVSEILDLPLLTSLETHLPPVVDILRNSMLLFDKLKNFKLAIKERKVRRTFEEHQEMMLFTKFPGDKNLMLENLDADSLVAVTGLLKKTDALWLEMGSLVHPLNVLAVDCVANLKNLTVRKCHALEYLVDLTRTKSSQVFPVLDALQIQGARRLKEIFHGLLPVGSLKQLGRLLIHGAPVLSHVWNMETHFARLEFLKLNNCKSLEVVVAWQESGHHDEEEANLINFPNLTHLHLQNLPSLVGISSKKVSKPNFPRLLKLQLQMLPKFVGLMTSSSNEVAVQHLLDPKVDFPVLKILHVAEMFNFKEIWNNQLSPDSFCELRELHLRSCNKISHLVPTYMQARLQKLEKINVSDCSALQEIFELRRSRINEDEGSRQTPSYISHPDQGMMQINNRIMDFQHLIDLSVGGCDSLRKVCSSSIARSLVNLEGLNIEKCRNMEEIVAAEEGEEAEDDNMFTHLRVLRLEDLPNLVGISSKKVCKLNFPRLLILTLEKLPKFVGLCSNGLAPTSTFNDVDVHHLLDPKVDFPVLQRLYIEEMCNFKEIWNNQLSLYSFCELRQLQVDSCDKISHLVPTYMQARLKKLEKIDVSDCSSLQEIFESRRSRVNEDEGSRQTPSYISHPDQGMMQINNQIMDFKGFRHLTDLSVSGCDGLRKVFSSSIARSIVNLKVVNIKKCRNMEEIVAAEEGEEAEDNNMFPHLRSLRLVDLPNLVSFSRDKYALDWPSVKYITIIRCPAMKNFCSGSLIIPMEMNIDIGDEIDENIRRELDMNSDAYLEMN